MAGKRQNTIFRKKNNCQRQLAIHAFSPNCSQPIATQHPPFALQYPPHFRYFTNSAENCAVAECEHTMDSLKDGQMPLQWAALYSTHIPKTQRNWLAALFIYKLTTCTWLGPYLAEGHSLLLLTLLFSLPQHRYRKDGFPGLNFQNCSALFSLSSFPQCSFPYSEILKVPIFSKLF